VAHKTEKITRVREEIPTETVTLMEKLKSALRTFAAARDWQRYHSPKNLVMALSVEAAELTEIFQWLEDDNSQQVDEPTRTHIAEEIGDVMIYLTILADKFNLDPLICARDKMEANAIKYPPLEKSKDPGVLS
jgi:dCTP diphosphatase